MERYDAVVVGAGPAGLVGSAVGAAGEHAASSSANNSNMVITLNDDWVFMFSPLLMNSGLDCDQARFLPAREYWQPGLGLDF